MAESRMIEPNTLLVNRRYRASRDLIWQAWTEPQRLRRWFGTPDYDLETVEIDLTVGGEYRKVFRTTENELVTVSGQYREIMKPERLVYTWNVTGAGRNLHDTLVTVTFVVHGDETEVTIRHEGLTTDEVREGHKQGWTGNLDQLAGEVEGEE